MGKKKDDKKVVSLVPAIVVPESEVVHANVPTAEEIKAQMRRDEEELERHLKMYAAVNPLNTSSGVEEQEEEETVTLDFTEEGVTAYEKVGEGVAMRDSAGNITLIEDEEVAEQIKRVIAEPTKPTEQQRYQDMITDRLVSKALGALLERLHNVQKESEKIAHSAGLGYLSERTADGLYQTVQKQKLEIRQSWSGGVINYDKIPTWAKPWVDDYITNGLNTLLDFVERD